LDGARGPTNVHLDIATIGPAQLRKPMRERGQLSLRLGIGFSERHKNADPPHAVGLLRGRQRGPRRCAAEPRDEFPPSHMILCPWFPTEPTKARMVWEPGLGRRLMALHVDLRFATGRSLFGHSGPGDRPRHRSRSKIRLGSLGYRKQSLVEIIQIVL